jgi:hypothetical protein
MLNNNNMLTRSSLNNPEMMRPPNGTSMSVDRGIGYNDVVMGEEYVNQTINNMPQEIITTGDIPDKYLDKPVCATPILPGNSKITFQGSVLAAVNGFRDVSKDAKTRLESQRFVERLLVEAGSCSKMNPSIMKDYRLRLFSIDAGKLDQILASEESLNANLHDNISCAVDAIIYDGKMSGELSPSPRERLRNWFPTVKQIGQESIEGYALRTSLTTDTNLFVMKAPRNPRNDDLVHEALVGFYAMNKLSHILPNYMRVYGYTKCSPPAIRNKEAVTWCSSSTPAVSYLITENIRDGPTIKEFMKDPNTTVFDFLAVFYQLINALNIAYKYYGYTHYDLHAGNVIIRKYSRLIAIPFFGTNDKPIGYIATVYVPYIIDYGFSRITVGGIGFGKIGLEKFGVTGETAFPMYDIYKILGFLGETIHTNSQTAHFNDINAVLERLFSFFGDGTLVERVRRRINNSRKDFYGPDSRYRDITHDNYINWLLQTSGINFHIYNNILDLISRGVYTAPINAGMDTCTFYDLVSSDDGPETSLEFCELVGAINSDSLLSSDAKQRALAWLNSRYDSHMYFTDTIVSINNKVQNVASIRSTRNISNGNIVPELSITPNLTTAPIASLYRDHLFDLIKIKDIASEVISYIKSSICALSTQGKYSLHKSEIEGLATITNEWNVFLRGQREILKRNVDYAKNIKWATLTTDDSIIKFWTKEHESLVLAI